MISRRKLSVTNSDAWDFLFSCEGTWCIDFHLSDFVPFCPSYCVLHVVVYFSLLVCCPTPFQVKFRLIGRHCPLTVSVVCTGDSACGWPRLALNCSVDFGFRVLEECVKVWGWPWRCILCRTRRGWISSWRSLMRSRIRKLWMQLVNIWWRKHRSNAHQMLLEPSNRHEFGSLFIVILKFRCLLGWQPHCLQRSTHYELQSEEPSIIWCCTSKTRMLPILFSSLKTNAIRWRPLRKRAMVWHKWSHASTADYKLVPRALICFSVEQEAQIVQRDAFVLPIP